MTRINFFTPTFNRTGSEVALFNLINHSLDSFEMKVVSKVIGELSSELSDKISFYNLSTYYNSVSGNRKNYVNLTNKALNVFKTDEKYFNTFYKNHPSELWYINTIIFPSAVSFAWEKKIPFILHVHELEPLFTKLTVEELKNAIEYPSLIIACSNVCADVLRQSGRKKPIEVIYPGLDFKAIIKNDLKSDEIRQKYSIPSDSFLWVMSGTMDINKNPSLFVDIAEYVIKRNDRAYFMWITGGKEENGYVSYCLKKSEQKGLSSKVIWTPNVKEKYYDYFNAGNGLMLTSSRESFSMITVEALFLGKAVVSFDCGGVKEIINSSNGIIVNGKDVKSMGDALLRVMDNEVTFDLLDQKSSVEKFDIVKIQADWKNLIDQSFSKN
jgi:L-malate glycosyltransferase